MRYELKAVTYRDRLLISLRNIGAVGLAGVLLTVFFQARWPGILDRWPWVFLFLICISVVVEAYRARGPVQTGFIEVTSTSLIRSLNGELKVIAFADVTKAVCYGFFGNKSILLKIGGEWKEIVYSAYSIDMIREFRRTLGPKLKEGAFEWLKTLHESKNGSMW